MKVLTPQQQTKLNRLIANGLPKQKALSLLKRRELRLRTSVKSTMNLRTGHWQLPTKE